MPPKISPRPAATPRKGKCSLHFPLDFSAKVGYHIPGCKAATLYMKEKTP